MRAKSGSRHYLIHSLDKKLEWASVLAYHILVVAGVALTAAGSAKLQQHEQPLDKAEKITKAGMSILAVAWGVLVGWTGLSFIAPRRRNSSLMCAGTVVSIFSCLGYRMLANNLSTVAYGYRLLAHLHRHPSLLQCCCAVHAEGVA